MNSVGGEVAAVVAAGDRPAAIAAAAEGPPFRCYLRCCCPWRCS